MSFGLGRRVRGGLVRWRWHILSIRLLTSRRISAETCGLDNVLPADDLCSRLETLCQYMIIYTFAFFIRVLVIRRIYTYTGSVVQYLWSCIPSPSIALFLGVRGSCVECHFLFSLVSPIVSWSMIIRLILGCLWALVFILNNILIFCDLQSLTSRVVFVPGPSLRISDSAWYHRTPLCHI